jgi:hypothetical protein
MVTRISEAMQRKQIFLICRYALILSTGAVAVSEVGEQTPHWPIALLIVLALISNLMLGQVEPFGFFDPWLQAPLIISDTSLISMALLLSHASQESFLFFFFVLIMAAKLENMATLAIGAAIIGFASFLVGGEGAGWASPALMRVPFTFATGIFFGYVVLPERSGEMLPFYPEPARITKRPSQKIAAFGPRPARQPFSSHGVSAGQVKRGIPARPWR